MRIRTLAVLVVALFAFASCGDDDAAAPADSSTTTTTAPTTTTVDEPTSFPPAELDLTHGGTVWAVVLAGAADVEHPALADAQRAAADAGYETGPTDCDEGAADALDLDGGYTVSVYLSSEADARQALAAFEERGVPGAAVAQVTTYCLD